MVNLFFRRDFSVYEIYPQSETPHLTKIARLVLENCILSDYGDLYVLPETVIWYWFYDDKIVFWVWDYRLNHSISFTIDVVEFYFPDLKVCFILSKALKLASNSFVGR